MDPGNASPAHGRSRLPAWTVLALLVVAGWTRPAQAQWRTYRSATLADHAGNDGDSFHVRAGRRRLLLRLYFVDAPETNARYPDRNTEQARHFGVAPSVIPAAGKAASAFTAEFLSRPFTVHTRLEDARGASAEDRYYALVMGSDGRWLDAALVSAGLARVFGWRADLPDGTPAATYLRELQKLEQEARTARRGLWGGTPVPSAGPAKVTRATRLVAVHDPTQILGTLREGTRVEVVGEQPPAWFRVRVGSGLDEVEGLVPRADLVPEAKAEGPPP